MLPINSSLQPQSEIIGDLDRILPLQIQMDKYKRNLAQAGLDLDAGRHPVVWRWNSSTSQARAQNLPGLATANHRIIHATANGIDFSKDNRSIDSPYLLTGAELLEARKLLKESSTTAPQSNLALSALGQQQFHHQTATQNRGLEAASMLLNNMEKQTAIIQKSQNATAMTNSRTNGNSTGKSSALKTFSPLQDEYLTKWVEGAISLHTPEDDDVLSPLHCFMRRYCVEAFSATEEDVATPRYGKSHGFKVTVGQVGIRCLHCKHLPLDKRAERAVCYPSSLKNIYHSIETWQRRHSSVCKQITPWVRKSIVELMEKSKTRAGGRRQYWEDSARFVFLYIEMASLSTGSDRFFVENLLNLTLFLFVPVL